MIAPQRLRSETGFDANLSFNRLALVASEAPKFRDLPCPLFADSCHLDRNRASAFSSSAALTKRPWWNAKSSLEFRKISNGISVECKSTKADCFGMTVESIKKAIAIGI